MPPLAGAGAAAGAGLPPLAGFGAGSICVGSRPAVSASVSVGGQFLRAQLGVADLDSNGNQLGATNVIVIRVGIDTSLGVPKTQLLSSGEAWVSSGGMSVHATWSKDEPTSAISLTDDQGVTIRLAPGNSWIELVPDGGSVSIVP